MSNSNNLAKNSVEQLSLDLIMVSLRGILSFFQLIRGRGSPRKITLSSRGFALSKTSNWGRRPTVMHGGDLEFSFSKYSKPQLLSQGLNGDDTLTI